MESSKIVKPAGVKPTEVEVAVAKAVLELQSTSKDLSADLAEVFFTSAKEIEVGANKKCVVIFVHAIVHKKLQKIQARLIRELEKKFSGKHVVFLAQRTIFSKQYSRIHRQVRPRSRTLTTVHEKILEDLVYPTQIVAKRTRVKLDGSRNLVVYLDPKDVKEVDYKMGTFATVYKKLTNKATVFTFPVQEE